MTLHARIAGLLLAALFAMPAAAGAQTRIERRAPAAPDVAVRIQNLAGSVRVTGWDRDTIAVTARVPADQADDFAFHVSGVGAKLGLWAAGEKPAAADVEVHVPAGSTVWVKTASADVHVSAVTGAIDVYAVSGTIEIDGAPRDVVAESLAGDVRLSVNARTVRAKSATATVALRGRIADATATTVSGPVEIAGAALERGRFESVDGDILYDGAIGPRSTLDFVTHAGAVRFSLPADAAAEFVINTYEGGFTNRFGAAVQSAGSALKGREFRFRLGRATVGGQVSVRTFKGQVIVEPQGN